VENWSWVDCRGQHCLYPNSLMLFIFFTPHKDLCLITYLHLGFTQTTYTTLRKIYYQLSNKATGPPWFRRRISGVCMVCSLAARHGGRPEFPAEGRPRPTCAGRSMARCRPGAGAGPPGSDVGSLGCAWCGVCRALPRRMTRKPV
jgi:hypothetical protein